ncbi:MAG TPA: hypothetical protein VFL31_02555 [Nitrospiraceae bacterium]|nr:hypothetical protein [Nitrospiraceae bacterium]
MIASRLQLLIWPLILVALAGSVHAEDFSGKVVGVTDGDTITVLHNGKGERVRLHGIVLTVARLATE